VTSPYGPIVLISKTGSRAERTLAELRPHLVERGLEHEVAFTGPDGDARRLARAALEDGKRFLVAVGGDGTVSEVLNGMIADDRPVREDAVLGIAAAGRGCDFIKTFGIPPLPSHAAAHLDGPESFPIDVGKITYVRDGETMSCYFANVAEVGLGAEVARRAARLPDVLGPTVYATAFWATILRNHSAHVTIDLVDRRFEGEMRNLVVANGQFFGGGMKVAPRAAPTDGLLDVQIQCTSRRETIALLPKVYRGEHVPHPEIREAKRVRTSITADRPLPVEADGETLGETPARFEVLAGAVRLKV
jgi:diacylglycerol kinase (ATP)